MPDYYKLEDLVKQGELDMDLALSDPSAGSGVQAGVGAMATGTDGSVWWKVGPDDTEWVRVNLIYKLGVTAADLPHNTKIVNGPAVAETLPDVDGYTKLFRLPTGKTAGPGNNSEWLAVGESSSELSASNVTPTISVGGVPSGVPIAAGTSIAEVLNQMLTPYQQPSLDSLVLSPSTAVLEVGEQFTPTSVTVNFSLDSDGNPPANASVSGTGFDSVYSLTSSPQVVNADGTPITVSTMSSRSWTVSAEDKNAASLTTKSDSVSWRWMHKFGAVPTVVSDAFSAQSVYDALQLSALTAGKSRNVTATTANNNASNYTYIVYSASYGDLSGIVQDGAIPVLDAFEKLGDFTITNAQGVSESHRFYKTTALGAFSSGTNLAIT